MLLALQEVEIIFQQVLQRVRCSFYPAVVQRSLKPIKRKETKNMFAKIKLKPCGKIAEKQLLLLEKRYPSVAIWDYVIMPDHIHAIIFLNNDTIEETNLPNSGGASPSPTLSEVICSFKSLTARACKQKYGVEKMFQRSYAEHIIRDYKDYETRKAYIQQNPIRWHCKQLSKQDK